MLNTVEKLEESPVQAPKTGAEILVDVLNELGVDYLFGHTGGAIIPIHVELNTRMERHQPAPHFVLFRQEGGAGHAAEGYAKASGKVGVALATSGPGSTNLVTPIADAYKDSIPCVFITGQVPSTMIGNDAFQEVDMVGITRPISKHNFLIKDAEDLNGVIRQAFHIAGSGRPGPVVVDICKNALLGKVVNGHKARVLKSYHPDVKLDETEAHTLLEGLLSAKRPVIKIGGGVISSNASRELRQFIDKYQIPFTQTFMGLGAANHDHPLFLGMPGMHGTVVANYALKNADFILAIGSRFDDRVAVREFGRGVTVAHVDIDHAELGKNIASRFELQANARDFLKFANRVDDIKSKDLSAWHKTVNGWKEQYALRYDHQTSFVKPQYFIEELSRLTKQTANIITGVGQHQMWAALYYAYQEPRQWISSGGLGTMGFGLPAAIGAYYGNPDKTNILIDGDGSFQMNIQELATVAANHIPVKAFILNNGYLGMVRQWEDMFNQGHHYETCLARTIECDPACVNNMECRTPNPNFLHLDKVFSGIHTLRINRTEQVGPAIEQVLSDNDPYVVDVWIDRNEDVKPMIPPGGTLDDIIYEV
ncbi:MAG: biosynthetic-type acetolactate synthase large subunit [Candidatus Competibacteraceae bacterium]